MSIRSRPGGDGGSVVAELAIALPAVVLVMVLGVGAMTAASAQLRLQDAVGAASRLIARGEDEARAMSLVETTLTGAAARIERGDGLVCVAATATVPIGLPVPIRAASCALAGGL